MNMPRFFQLITATVVLSSAAIITPVQAGDERIADYPMVEHTVFNTLGEYLPMRAELSELKQDEPEIYNDVIWELYDIAESYKMTRIEAGTVAAELYLQMDLKDMEAEWLAMEYLDAQSHQPHPAIDEYQALQQVVEEMFTLDMQIRELENEQIWSKLTPEQRSELTAWEASRLKMKAEIVQRELDDYLADEEEFALLWGELE